MLTALSMVADKCHHVYLKVSSGFGELNLRLLVGCTITTTSLISCQDGHDRTHAGACMRMMQLHAR